jgi:type IV pilus assembly protein PilC
LPIAQCLQILSEQSESKVLRDVTAKIASDVQGGATLAESFGKYPKTFDTPLRQHAGRRRVRRRARRLLAGAVDLHREGGQAQGPGQERLGVPGHDHQRGRPRHHLHDGLRAADVANMFKNMGAELPLPTKIVIFMSDMTRRYIIFILAGIGAAIYAIKRYYGTDNGSMVIDTFMLKVPVVGMLIRKIAVARFTRTLGTLISSGVPSWKASSSQPAPPAIAWWRSR